MAGNVEGGGERFSVAIQVGASVVSCAAYFKHRDPIVFCAGCKCIPDVLYILDDNIPCCKGCFRGAFGFNSLKASIKTGTHQRKLQLEINRAFVDALVECPICRRNGMYTDFKDHIQADHPDLWNHIEEQQASEAERENGVRPPPEFESVHPAAKKEEDEDSSQTLAATGLHTTDRRVNCTSDVREGLNRSASLEQEQNKDVLPLYQKFEILFKEEVIRYFENNMKDVVGVTNSKEHLERCPMVKTMFSKWFPNAWDKYQEHQETQCSECSERCGSFAEVARNCRKFQSELEVLATDGMFEYYQKHADDCPGSNDGNNGFEIHEGSCRHRPGSCKHCLQKFPTIIQLEDEHYPQCPNIRVKCSLYKLGCSFSAARRDVAAHEATTKHTDMLVENVCLLKAENESLKRTIENQEKKFQGIIENIKDSLAKTENREKIAFERLEARTSTRQRDIEARLADVEERLRSYHLPLEELLRGISSLK